mgnify:CR=1 FL=1
MRIRFLYCTAFDRITIVPGVVAVAPSNQTDSEAVTRWGTIDWREDGLHIGSGTNEYFLARAKIESHR